MNFAARLSGFSFSQKTPPVRPLHLGPTSTATHWGGTRQKLSVLLHIASATSWPEANGAMTVSPVTAGLEARKTRAIFKMVEQAKKMAVAAGIPLVIANFGPVETEAKSRLYRRFGTDLGTTVITGETRNFLWR